MRILELSGPSHVSLICLGGTRMLYLKRLTETQTCDENSPRLNFTSIIL